MNRLLLSILFIPSMSFAAPNRVTGKYDNGDTVTINRNFHDIQNALSITTLQSQFRIKVGVFTGSGSSGNQSVTGIGFKPRLILFAMGVGDASSWVSSVGATDGTSSFVIGGIANDGGTVGGFNTNTSLVLRQATTAGGSATDGNIVSFDTDGFTVSWTVGTSNVVGYVAFQ